MNNKEAGTIDKLSGYDADKGMEHMNIIVAGNLSVLDLWDDYVEKNKRLFQLQEEELWINSMSKDAHHKEAPVLNM